MREVIKDIEQLEVAGELIDKNTPTASRLALFLIDNLAELIMYRRSLYEFRYDESWPLVFRPRKYPIKRIKEIKDHFKPKINLIVNHLKLITESDGIVLRIGHALRNEAYHNGILRDRILIQITRAYFQTVCEIFPSLWIDSYSYSREEEVKKLLDKYGVNSIFITNDIIKIIYEKILQGRQFDSIALAESISDDLIKRIREIIDALEDSPSANRAMSADERLKWLQFRNEGIFEFGIVENDEEYHAKWGKIQDEFAVYRPKVTIKKLNRWIEKAMAILKENDKGRIFQKFWEIDEQFLKIENLVMEAVIEYEKEIP
jgi:hypothetical protein